MNWGAFLLDPLNITGIQDMGTAPPRPNAPPPPAAPAPLPPPPGLQLDMSNPPPYGVTAGSPDGRPVRSEPSKPQGYLQSMLGQESPFKPTWSYSQGKGPVWSTGSEPAKAPFQGNRI